MKFGLSTEHWSLLDELAIQPLKSHGAQVFIFGSRVRGQHQPYSDIDLLYKTEKPLNLASIFEIKSALEESQLPYKVDLVQFDDLAVSYKENIIREMIEL